MTNSMEYRGDCTLHVIDDTAFLIVDGIIPSAELQSDFNTDPILTDIIDLHALTANIFDICYFFQGELKKRKKNGLED